MSSVCDSYWSRNYHNDTGIHVILSETGVVSQMNSIKDIIISATIEELTEEEQQDYLVAEEHFRAQFLKGFKKDLSG